MRKTIDSKLSRFGVKGPGKAWLMRALHPAGDHPSPGLPDASAAAVMRPDYRVQLTIGSPDAGSWDCMIWAPPGDVNTLYYAVGPAPCNFSLPEPPIGARVGVLGLQLNQVTNYSFVATGLAVNNVEGFASVLLTGTRPAYEAYAFRHQYKSITAHLIASSISNQGAVYAAQLAPVMRDTGFQVHNLVGDDPPAVGLASVTTCVLPTDETMLSAMCPDLYTGEARDGIYMPLHLTGPVQAYARTVRTNAWGTVPGAPTSLLYPCGFVSGYTATEFTTGAAVVPNNGVQGPTSPGVSWPFLATYATGLVTPDATPVNLPEYLLDTGYDNVNVGVIFFRGLAGGGALGSSIQIKVCAGLEAIPLPTAPNRIYTQEAAPYDPRAIEAYYTMCMELRDAYPASFNSLESILDAIGSAASKVWDVFSPALTQAAPAIIEHLMAGSTRERRLPLQPPMSVRRAQPARSRSAATSRSGSRVRIMAGAPTRKGGRGIRRK